MHDTKSQTISTVAAALQHYGNLSKQELIELPGVSLTLSQIDAIGLWRDVKREALLLLAWQRSGFAAEWNVQPLSVNELPERTQPQVELCASPDKAAQPRKSKRKQATGVYVGRSTQQMMDRVNDSKVMGAQEMREWCLAMFHASAPRASFRDLPV